MLLPPISPDVAGAVVRQAHADSPFPSSPCPTRLRLRLRLLSPVRTHSSSISLSAAVPSRPAKPPVCTADELHYAPVSGAGWRLALWRYKPPPHAPVRNHPLMLLSGVGTNAIGFDLSPQETKWLWPCKTDKKKRTNSKEPICGCSLDQTLGKLEVLNFVREQLDGRC